MKQSHPIPVWIGRETPLNSSISPFTLVNDSIIFHEVFSNDVYAINKRTLELELRYSWNFGKYNFAYTDLPPDKTSKEYMQFFSDTDAAYDLKCNVESGGYIITQLVHKSSGLNIFHSKETKVNYNIERFKEGLDLCVVLGGFEGGIYSYMESRYFKYVFNPKDLDADYKQIISALNSDANPIMIEYYFKPHE